MLTMHISEKGLTSKIYENLMKLFFLSKSPPLKIDLRLKLALEKCEL